MIQLPQVRFRALVTLDPAGAHPGTPLHPATREYPNHTHSLMVRVRSRQSPGHVRSFPAEICWDGEGPLRPGDHAVVTITVADAEAERFLAAGQRFTLWSGDDVGRGVVSRRVYTEYSPS